MSLTKVEIIGFGDKKLMTEAVGKFSIPVNPENFTRTMVIEQDQTQNRGSGGGSPKFDAKKPEEVKFDFILDGTNTIEGYPQELKNLPVSEQLDLFLFIVYNMNGKKHKPNFVKILWGDHLSFDCTLTSITISYTLFKPNGNALRAKLSVAFTEYTEPEAQSRKDDKSSPDLTHVRIVNDADKIYNKTNEIYSSPSFYMQVAKVNKLVNFRSLKGLNQMIFPPLAKNAENR